MFMEAWKQIPSTPFLPFRLHSGSSRCVLELQASGLSHLWHQGLSTALHIQISCILCRGGGAVLLRYACEEALETTQLQAPDSLSYNGSFGAKRTRKNDACIEIYYLPRNVQNRSGPVDNAHFLQPNAFLIWMACWAEMCDYLEFCADGWFVDGLSCDQGEHTVKHPEGS